MKYYVIYSLSAKEYLTNIGWWSNNIEEAVQFTYVELAEDCIRTKKLSLVEIKTIYV